MSEDQDIIISEFSQKVKSLLGNHIRKIILFGSRARGDQKVYSDYDFLIIVDKRNLILKESILDICVDILNKYNTLISFILCDEREWARKKKFPIGLNIIKEGVEL